ncbi:hypothetical protein DFP72DRAFT_1138047, partial [Ephemerocybe angulata]
RRGKASPAEPTHTILPAALLRRRQEVVFSLERSTDGHRPGLVVWDVCACRGTSEREGGVHALDAALGLRVFTREREDACGDEAWGTRGKRASSLRAVYRIDARGTGTFLYPIIINAFILGVSTDSAAIRTGKRDRRMREWRANSGWLSSRGAQSVRRPTKRSLVHSTGLSVSLIFHLLHLRVFLNTNVLLLLRDTGIQVYDGFDADNVDVASKHRDPLAHSIHIAPRLKNNHNHNPAPPAGFQHSLQAIPAVSGIAPQVFDERRHCRSPVVLRPMRRWRRCAVGCRVCIGIGVRVRARLVEVG